MGKVFALVILSVGLLVGVIALVENLYGPDAVEETQEGGGVNDGSLYSLLLRLAGHQEAPPASFTERLTQHWDKDNMEEYALVFLIILTSMASILLLFTWHNFAHADMPEESFTATHSGAAAASLTREIWSDACCCISPCGVSGIKTYTITVKGEMGGNPCAQLKMTIHTAKELSEEILIALEELILQTLNSAEDIDSPERLLEVVYNTVMDYLRQHSLVDD